MVLKNPSVERFYLFNETSCWWLQWKDHILLHLESPHQATGNSMNMQDFTKPDKLLLHFYKHNSSKHPVRFCFRHNINNIRVSESACVCVCVFFNCCLATPRSTLWHCQGGSLTNLMLISTFEGYLTQRSLGISKC